MQLSIIVPIYNVEKYIRPCLESILRQGIDAQCYEIIIVNDGTKDHSMEMIYDIIESHSNIKVLEQSNQGISVTRNTGLSAASGDYIFFIDSDDLLIYDYLGKMLDDACQNKPDILIAGFVKMTDDAISNGHIPAPMAYTSNPIPEGRRALEFLNPQECFVWRALYKRDFLDKYAIRFIPGIYFEDILFTTECYLKCRRCIITDNTFYVYRQHPGSIVSAINKKKIMDFNFVIARLWEMRNWHISPVEQKKLMNLIFKTYLIQVWYISHHKNLLAERKEITKDLKMKVPHLKFSGGIKQYMISFFYQHMPNTYIRLRSLL